MEYSCKLYEDMLIIELRADLDHHLANKLREEIDEYIQKNNLHKILFDFEQVSFMDSSGIGLIMGRYRKIGDKCKMAVCGVNISVKRIFEISGLYKLVKVFDTAVDALRFLQEVG